MYRYEPRCRVYIWVHICDRRFSQKGVSIVANCNLFQATLPTHRPTGTMTYHTLTEMRVHNMATHFGERGVGYYACGPVGQGVSSSRGWPIYSRGYKQPSLHSQQQHTHDTQSAFSSICIFSSIISNTHFNQKSSCRFIVAPPPLLAGLGYKIPCYDDAYLKLFNAARLP